MGFAIYGTPIYKEINEKNIKNFIDFKFSGWLYDEFSYKYYTKISYNIDLKRYSKGITKDFYKLTNNDIINSKKQENDFALWELKTLKHLTQIIKTFFNFYNLDEFNYISFKNEFESYDKTFNNNAFKKFFKKYRYKNNIPVMKSSAIVSTFLKEQYLKAGYKTRLRKINLYLLILMYIDFIKIEKFLEGKIDNTIIETQPKVKENLYPRIFTTPNAYNIFKNFTEKIEQRTETADYSFIFRIMQKDNLIFEDIKNKEYIEWLNKHNITSIDMIKTYDNCKTKHKIDFYTTLKNLYKG